jgi:hypothetical protein
MHAHGAALPTSTAAEAIPQVQRRAAQRRASMGEFPSLDIDSSAPPVAMGRSLTAEQAHATWNLMPGAQCGCVVCARACERGSGCLGKLLKPGVSYHHAALPPILTLRCGTRWLWSAC